MKAIIIIISIVLLIAIAQIFISRSTQQTEQRSYKVIKKFDKFEIRKYDPALFSSVKLNKKGYKESSSEGFGILAGYIFGANETNEKIAMTSPVVMELGDTSKMMFMVPKNYNLKNLPNPKNPKIVFEKQEEKIIAAIRFDGWADDEKIEKYKSILMNELVKEKLNYINKFTFL
ncbi:MAG: heme-binding protein, partial [Flavobacteriaceae bacterium]|nr:heme-binding protein [Flavobacteriaceae bacterium]